MTDPKNPRRVSALYLLVAGLCIAAIAGYCWILEQKIEVLNQRLENTKSNLDKRLQGLLEQQTLYKGYTNRNFGRLVSLEKVVFNGGKDGGGKPGDVEEHQ